MDISSIKRNLDTQGYAILKNPPLLTPDQLEKIIFVSDLYVQLIPFRTLSQPPFH